MRLSSVTFFFLMGLALLACSSSARQIVVDQQHPQAADTNPGTAAQPLLTLTEACRRAGPGDTVTVHAGIYREQITPTRSGTADQPIIFQAAKGQTVHVRGSDVVDGFVREGQDWVKRPWKKRFYWHEKSMGRTVTRHKYNASARSEMVFVDGEQLLWCPDIKNLEVGGFVWAENGSELRLRLPKGTDLDNRIVEVPVRASVVCSWPNVDIPRDWVEYQRKLSEGKTDLKLPKYDYIVIRGFDFAHNATSLNRAGVRVQGEHWTVEDCTIRQMASVGLSASSNDAMIRRNVAIRNGQVGFGGGGKGGRLIDNISLFDNSRDYNTSWGGAANKFAFCEDWVVRGQITLGGGAGVWFDLDCRNVTIEDCVILPNHLGRAGGSHGGIFYEISLDGVIRNNVIFGNLFNLQFNSVYGGGVTISSSLGSRAEDNVILFCDGGLGLPANGRGGNTKFSDLLESKYGVDRFCGRDNVFDRNLVVGSLSTPMYLRVNDMGGTDPEHGNRFDNTSIIASRSGPVVQWGNQSFGNVNAFNESTPQAQGNTHVDMLTQATDQERERLDWAAGRLIYATELVTGRKLAPADDVRLKAIWFLPPGVAQGLWIQTHEEPILLISSSGAGQTRFLTRSTEVEVWSSRSPEWQTVQPTRGLLELSVEQGYYVLKGLGRDAVPADFAELIATRNGRPVRSIAAEQPFQWNLRVHNFDTQPVRVTAKGSGFEVVDEQIPAEQAAIFSTSQSAESPEAAVELTMGGRTLSLAGSVTIVEPISVPHVDDVQQSEDPPSPQSSPIGIYRGQQAVADLYDFHSGVGWRGVDDLSATARLYWNDEHLSIVVDVRDDVIRPARGDAPYDGDCVEIFLDARQTHLGQSAYSEGAYQIFLRAPKDKSVQEFAVEGRSPEGAKASGKRTDDGYEITLQVPWSTLNRNTKKGVPMLLGFDLAIDDGDGMSGRKGRRTQLVWYGTGKNYGDASLFGRIRIEPKSGN